MNNRVPAEGFPPGEFLKDELEERGWTQEELAAIIGRPPAVINQIISGKRGISPETAREIGAALGSSAMYWMNLESAYRLWRAGPAPVRIEQEAAIRAKFPVREMLKRGWLAGSENPEVLLGQVCQFFGISEINEEPRLMHAAKKTGYPSDISGEQRAWLFRVRQIATAMKVRAYSAGALRKALDGLRGLLKSVDDIRLVPRILADCGVRFVIVEHVPSSKIDGVCFWVGDRATSPVIGMSLRLDRIDNFWFVLRHEIEHVLNGDGRSVAVVDRDTVDADSVQDITDEELRANTAAREFCVPSSEMNGFIERYHPIYTEQKLLGFSQRMNVHPGIVAGQLHHRTKNYRLFRKHLSRVRTVVAPVAMTDGYKQTISL